MINIIYIFPRYYCIEHNKVDSQQILTGVPFGKHCLVGLLGTFESSKFWPIAQMSNAEKAKISKTLDIFIFFFLLIPNKVIMVLLLFNYIHSEKTSTYIRCKISGEY